MSRWESKTAIHTALIKFYIPPDQVMIWLKSLLDLDQISQFRWRDIKNNVTMNAPLAFPAVHFLWILRTSPLPLLLVLYQDLWWCMHALELVWGQGRKGERDERGIGRGVKGRGVSWLFVLHCSHPCDQSREETFRALLQERHVVCFFKGEYNLKNSPLCFASRMNT